MDVWPRSRLDRGRIDGGDQWGVAPAPYAHGGRAQHHDRGQRVQSLLLHRRPTAPSAFTRPTPDTSTSMRRTSGLVSAAVGAGWDTSNSRTTMGIGPASTAARKLVRPVTSVM